MKILSIETTTGICGIAYHDNNQLIAIVEEELYREHSEKLPLFFESLRDQTEIDLGKLDGIAVSIGPGSFTGLRVGLSYAKGLAFSSNLPLVPVPTLQSLAEGANCEGKIRVMVKSHKDMIYFQDFTLIKDEVNPERANIEKWEIIKPSLNLFDKIVQYGCEEFLVESPEVKKVVNIKPSAKLIGETASKYYDRFKLTDFYQLEPEYITQLKIQRPVK
tara:strand:- start:637 stop:1290 length:654 start_codon:yes stop_codon:yes gene_type:complete